MQIPIEHKIIITKARNGNREAFGHLVQQHQQYAFNLAFRIVHNEDEAKDVIQDSFVKIWKNMKLYNPNIKFTTWMYSIITNTAIDHLRSTKKVELVNIDNFHEKIEHLKAENPETHLSNKEIGSLIRLISETLSEKQRLVFTLKDIQDLNSIEVGDILGMSATSIKSNLHYARKSIREKLQKLLSYEGRSI